MPHYEIMHAQGMDYLIDGHTIHFSLTERFFFALLFNARGAWVYKDKWITALPRWDDKPPLTMNRLILVKMYHMRNKLKPTRFRIENNKDVGYRFIRV